MNNNMQSCKICGSSSLSLFAHTATCKECEVLLCYPYPSSDDEIYRSGIGRDKEDDIEQIKNVKLQWHLKSGKRNHENFTNMVYFSLEGADRFRPMKILDYGGGGQFALILKSLYPLSEVFVVDISDAKLLDQFKPLNHQIKFDDFDDDNTNFDFIFMNDVFEHVSDPLNVLKRLSRKLASQDSGIFIDTPRQFWLYPITKFFSKEIHTKLLRGTVDYDHQQIWTKNCFSKVVTAANLRIEKYTVVSEFTQNSGFYLQNMKINSRLLRLFGQIFFMMAPYIAKNKIISVLKPI